MRPHRRKNLLTGEWVLVSPHRAARPWQGQTEAPRDAVRPAHDPACYLCPSNTRANGATNPRYEATWVFPNDFPALLDEDASTTEVDALFESEAVRGTCRVICFSPRHDLTLPDLTLDELGEVIDTWAREVEELSERYAWVQVFENKGAVMGCSNPHPHGQVWALDALPNEASKERQRQRDWFAARKRPLLIEVVEAELRLQQRVVVENDEWVAFVPNWALWPFETLLVPKRHAGHLHRLDELQRAQLPDVLRRLLRRYDNLFGVSFPYSMGWHGAPTGSEGDESFQLHAHFYPPLLRSATVKKFMVGFEMLGEGQRDLTPEQAAAALQACSEEPLFRRSDDEPSTSDSGE
ncbi:MAG: UDP-glucose--hexose-1-phosphate uridylyltransferase [Myxococcota bacterium]